jgi:hypothetical protein
MELPADWRKFNPPADARAVLEQCQGVTVASTTGQLIALATAGKLLSEYNEVAYEVPAKGRLVEANVAAVRNGVVVNYTEPYMRRRDPDCMLVADDLPTDKETFEERYGISFAEVRTEALDWLKTQELLVFALYAGQADMGMETLVLAPANAGFFALGLAMLQGIIPFEAVSDTFEPRAVIYVAPPLRHTRFAGKQVVVHRRLADLHEMFSFNLYPARARRRASTAC